MIAPVVVPLLSAADTCVGAKKHTNEITARDMNRDFKNCVRRNLTKLLGVLQLLMNMGLTSCVSFIALTVQLAAAGRGNFFVKGLFLHNI